MYNSNKHYDEIRQTNININVNLENGVYVFDALESANGKTWLCKCLKSLELLGENVIGYTYDDYKNGVDLVEKVNNIKPVVIELDRYDMYNGAYSEYIEKWGESAIVLIVCNGTPKIGCESDWCNIEITDHNSLEVYN